MKPKYDTPYGKARAIRLSKLDAANRAFIELHQSSVQQHIAHVPRRYEGHFLAASYAVSILDSLGEDKLLDLEKQDVVHPSTISGGSLRVAKHCIEDYLGGQRNFSTDRFEQLYRTCSSAHRTIQRGLVR